MNTSASLHVKLPNRVFFVINNLLPSIKIYAFNLTERLLKEGYAVNQAAAAATAAF